MRQIVLDTETTGTEVNQGHRIIEIGCVELVNRRFTGNVFHKYINPQRASDVAAFAVHGIKDEFLATQPLFQEISEQLIDFLKDAELIIHNAPFDVAFLNQELKLISKTAIQITDYCTILDTLPLARRLHPGQRNSLDALCKRYNVDNSQRNYHGALLDAQLLAQVYLAMTGGQTSLFAEMHEVKEISITSSQSAVIIANSQSISSRIIRADANELAEHTAYLSKLDKAASKGCLWLKTDTAEDSQDAPTF